MKRKNILISLLLISMTSACAPYITDKKKTEHKLNYKEVSLNWDDNTFTHGENVLSIPENWGYGINGQRSKFQSYDCHDIQFVYFETIISYSDATVKTELEFNELVKIAPEEKEKIFEINTTNLNVDSKIIIKDELIDDCYFLYDLNEDFTNRCYFKIARTYIDEIKTGNFNQINVKLKYYVHYDGSCSFKINEFDDGLNDIGYYSSVSIVYNPAL